MPRQYLSDTTGALHHVICRGIDRRKISIDKDDYLLFLKRLEARRFLQLHREARVKNLRQLYCSIPPCPLCSMRAYFPVFDDNALFDSFCL